ncbi:hypothetical protein TNCV_4967651 [Trichonephila clavipes]|nr:hypothetical protein TNCV_4967651 [Trichonephila clavipes]
MTPLRRCFVDDSSNLYTGGIFGDSSNLYTGEIFTLDSNEECNLYTEEATPCYDFQQDRSYLTWLVQQKNKKGKIKKWHVDPQRFPVLDKSDPSDETQYIFFADMSIDEEYKMTYSEKISLGQKNTTTINCNCYGVSQLLL